MAEPYENKNRSAIDYVSSSSPIYCTEEGSAAIAVLHDPFVDEMKENEYYEDDYETQPIVITNTLRDPSPLIDFDEKIDETSLEVQKFCKRFNVRPSQLLESRGVIASIFYEANICMCGDEFSECLLMCVRCDTSLTMLERIEKIISIKKALEDVMITDGDECEEVNESSLERLVIQLFPKFPMKIIKQLREVFKPLLTLPLKYAKTVAQDTFLYAASVFSLLRQLWIAPNYEFIGHALFNFSVITKMYLKVKVSTREISRLADMCVAQATKWNEERTTQARNEEPSVMDEPEEWRLIYNRLLESDFVGTLRTMLVNMVAYKCFEKDVASKICSYVGAPRRRLPIIDVIPVFMESIIKLVQFGEAVMRGEPLHEIFFSKDAVSEALVAAHDLMLYKDRLYTGLPIPRGKCQLEYRREAVALVELFEMFSKELSPFDHRVDKVKKTKELLLDEIARIENKLNGDQRRPPLAICLHGDPGIGKSQLLFLAPRVYSSIRGWDYVDTLTYARDPLSVYWEGYHPYSNPIIHYSEVGNESRDVARTRGSPTLVEVNSLIDGTQFQCNMAFEDKGKVYATPEMVIVDTNNANMHADITMSNPSAIYRRFIYVEAKVKPSFRLPQSTSLDVNKSLRVGGNLLDRYTFNVTRRIPNGNCKFKEEHLLLNGSLDELIATYAALFTAHLENNAKLEQFDVNEYITEQMKILLRNVPEGPDQLQNKIDATAKKAKSASTVDLSSLTVQAESFEDPMLYDTPEIDVFGQASEFMFKARNYCSKLTSAFLLWACYTMAFQVNKTKINRYGKHFMWAFPAMLTSVFGFYGFVGFSGLMYFAVYRLRLTFMRWLGTDPATVRRKENILKYMLGMESYDPGAAYCDVSTWVTIALAILSGWATSKFISHLYGNNDKLGATQSSHFAEEHEVNERIYAHEDYMEASTSSHRYKKKLHAGWGSSYLGMNAAVFTGDMEDLFKCVSRNVRKAVVAQRGSKVRVKTHVFGLCENFALINTHAYSDGDLLYFCKNDFTIPNRRSVEIMQKFDLGNDLTLLQVNDQFKDVTKHLFERHELLVAYEGMINGEKSPCSYIDEELLFKPNTKINGAHVVNFMNHKIGLCGLPLVGQVTSNSAALLGIHGAGADFDDAGFSIPLVRSVIMNGILSLKEEDKFVSITSEAEFEIEREPHSQKSFFRYNDLIHIEDYGKLPGPVLIKSKSKLVRRKFPNLDRFMETHLKFERDEIYWKPLMQPMTVKGQYLDAASIAVNKMNTPLVELDRTILRKCVDELVERIVVSQKSKDDFECWSPITMEEAINGAAHDAYLRSMNMNTSSGFGYKGKKSVHFPVTKMVDNMEYREPTNDLKQRLNMVLDKWSKGEAVKFVFLGQYKDEPRLREKVLKGKTRIFYMTPQDLLVLTRMLLSRFYTCMVEDCDIFCVALGFDMHVAGDEMVNRLNAFCNDSKEIEWDTPCIFEGDYGGYDVSNPFPIARAACTVIYEVCEQLGYNEQALLLLKMLLSENLYPNVSIYNDLFCKPGMQPSGKYGTAEDNSLRGLLLLMYAWYSHKKLYKKSFFNGVLPYIYGDDVIAGVKPKFRKHFNNNYYQEFVESHYGMTFTSASKSLDMLPFVTLRTMSFLRRNFVKSPYEDVSIAQLNLNSIYKTLEWRLASTSICDMQQDEAALQSVLWELFMHSWDFEHFDAMRRDLKDMYFAKYQVYPTLPTFDIIYERIYGVNPQRSEIDTTIDWTQISISVQSDFFRKLKRKKEPLIEEKKDYDVEERSMDDSILGLERELKDLKAIVSRWEDEGYDFEYLVYSDYLNHHHHERRMLKPKIDTYLHMNDIEATLKSCKRIRNKTWRATVESEFMMTETGNNPEEKIENLVDMGGNETVEAHAGISSYIDVGADEKARMSAFFERPIEISNFEIAPDSSAFSVFPVWDLYTKNPTVRAKLRNYAYFKADLTIRIVISGSPFHYGKILLSYQPLAEGNDNLLWYEANYTSASYIRPLYVNYLSQCEGCIRTDVKANRPIDIHVPYMLPKPMANLHNESTSVIADTSSFFDIENMGDLYFVTINDIRSSSTSPTPVGVQILCYATNVELGCITATQMQITTESEKFVEMEEKLDERATGPIERVSSRLAQYADALSVVPQIRPLALASGLVFKGVKELSSIMGFSKPSIYEDVSYVKARPWSNSATTIGSSTCERLSLDPKQELTVDPRMLGHEKDDMSLHEVYTRQSYLTTFEWATTDVPLSGSIFLCKVSPQMDTYAVDVDRYYVQPTALSFVQSVFKWWHGEIEYHIEVVCSKFHRGKLAVYYEPNVYQGTIIDADIALNKNFIQIIDLQESQDMVFCVKWAQSDGMLLCERPGFGRYHHGTSFSFTAAPYAVNGYFGVVPYTTLQSPDGSSVSVNVYARGKKMVFGFMTQENLPTERTSVGSVESEYFMDDHEVKCVDLNPTSDNMNQLGYYYFGEVPTSFRSLLKRYTRAGVYTHTATSSASSVTYHNRIYEKPYPSYDSSDFHIPSLFRYLSLAYVGYKGSRRHRVRIMNTTTGEAADAGRLGCVSVTLGGSTTAESITTSTTPAYTQMRGSVIFNPQTNAGIEFETPFYSRNLFSISFNENLESSAYEDTSWIKSFDVTADMHVEINDNVTVAHDAAAGEDFSFLRFNGAPAYTVAV